MHGDEGDYMQMGGLPLCQMCLRLFGVGARLMRIELVTAQHVTTVYWLHAVQPTMCVKLWGLDQRSTSTEQQGRISCTAWQVATWFAAK